MGNARRDGGYEQQAMDLAPFDVSKYAIGVGELVVEKILLVYSHSRRSHHYLLTTYRT